MSYQLFGRARPKNPIPPAQIEAAKGALIAEASKPPKKRKANQVLQVLVRSCRWEPLILYMEALVKRGHEHREICAIVKPFIPSATPAAINAALRRGRDQRALQLLQQKRKKGGPPEKGGGRSRC